MEGWFKVNRKIIDSKIFDNSELLKIWIWCLAKASYIERDSITDDGQIIHLLPGQFYTGRFEGSRALKMKPTTFWDRLNKLKKLENIDIKSNNKYSVVTIVNWAKYQTNDLKNDNEIDIRMTTDRHKQEYKEYSIYINKYKESNCRTLYEKMRFLRMIKNDTNYNLSPEEEKEFELYILGGNK